MGGAGASCESESLYRRETGQNRKSGGRSASAGLSISALPALCLAYEMNIKSPRTVCFDSVFDKNGLSTCMRYV